MSSWSIKKAREVYSIPNWSDGFFDINEKGQLIFHDKDNKKSASFDKIVAAVHKAGLQMPVLARFTGILKNRLLNLIDAFDQTHQRLNYKALYTVIYPIKVNQQRSVVEGLLNYGGDRIGLEAGSKPELLAVMSLMEPGGVIVCNGYKDREFIELAMTALSIGFQVYIVIEKLSELELLIEVANDFRLKPHIGLRIRLASTGSGNWQNSGGDKSKFGLASSEVILAINKIKSADMSDCLKMIHFHMGSQIANIEDIKKGVNEAAQYFVQCSKLINPVSIINVGGGLGIDYEGTKSQSYFSKNYNTEDYARVVTSSIQEACKKNNLPEPNIFSESGRALTAHHAVLITNVLEVEQPPDLLADDELIAVDTNQPDALINLARLKNKPESQNSEETYRLAGEYLSELQKSFSAGRVSLQQRAKAEKLYIFICTVLRKQLDPENYNQRKILDELNEKLVDKYFCNFSIFQSVPDVWAMQQIFPIVPVQRLDERPLRRGVVVDVTCDSDGRIDHYVDNVGIEASLPLHSLESDKDYLLAIFLVGAYQEILGDIHNLFGDTDSVHINISEDGVPELSEIIQGDTVSNVLNYVHYDSQTLETTLTKKINTPVDMQSAVKEKLLGIVKRGLTGKTYLKS